jgi:uncharacterized protein YndB with AHSA1/START domain
MVRRLRKGDTATSSIEVDRPPEDVWALVGDPTRFPELSPETFRVSWRRGATAPSIGAKFRGWNRRRLAVWATTCRVDAYEPGRLLSFTPVTAGSLTRWTWQVEPGASPGTTRLTETVELAKDMPVFLVGYELLAMGDGDRLAALQDNVAASVARVKEHLEARAG